jgi:GNAT superfamily N-acetyltransferase
VFNAVVWDVAVAPAWQRSGIGRGLMERLTRGLVEDGIETVALYAEPKVGEGREEGPRPEWRGRSARLRAGHKPAPAPGALPQPPARTDQTKPTKPGAKKVIALYSKLGFKSDVDGIKGMAFQRREPQGGSGGAKRFATVGARR